MGFNRFLKSSGREEMSHYFMNDDSVKSNEKVTKAMIQGQLFTFWTDYNVFSKNGLDFGTRTLLESIDIKSLKGKILDFGCGYGPIGIFLAKNNLQVDMVDVNLRALHLAEKNAEINRVNVSIFESDIYSNITEKYDAIITNPPIRVGKKILYEILIGAKEYLKEEGTLIFVIHKDQGAKSVIKDMSEFYQVTVLEKNKGFYVIACKLH